MWDFAVPAGQLVRLLVDIPVPSYFLVSVSIRARAPVHSCARVPLLKARRFRICVSISRGAKMEIVDTSTRRYDAPTPHVDHDITRFFRPCNSLFEICLSKHLPVFVPAFGGDAPF